MKLLSWLIRAINALNKLFGHTFSFLAIGIVAVCFWVVVERYLFTTTKLWMQDLYVWLNGAMFTAVAGYALLKDNHVRVDIFYRPASSRWKAMADLIGVILFLIPYVTVVLVYAMPFVLRSWRYMENSANVGGMPGLYVLKSFIVLFAALVGLQALAMLSRSILVLGKREDLVPPDYRYYKAD